MSAARKALDATDVDLILPFVHADGAEEIRDALDRTMKSSGPPSGCTALIARHHQDSRSAPGSPNDQRMMRDASTTSSTPPIETCTSSGRCIASGRRAASSRKAV